ncbi:MAG: MerR family transcriptional regulator [Ruminococcaceae bacterium]|nr:MerR family transcriptional regulator [Oscillospiraceae bacterium]
MKELSALTGISERTIYYYIDDGVFVPEKRSEDYKGRKSYDYTENDVRQLKQIALLRKYDFTIKDIKLLKKEQINISDVLERNIEESTESIEEKSNNISAMKKALENNPSNLDELCEMLSNPTIEKMPAISDGKAVTVWSDIKLVLRALGILGLWIIMVWGMTKSSVALFLMFSAFYIVPLILDTVAFILEVSEKGGMVMLASRILRVVMAFIFIFSFGYSAVQSKTREADLKTKKLQASISADAFTGMPEDESTVYLKDYRELDSRSDDGCFSAVLLKDVYIFDEAFEMEMALSEGSTPKDLYLDIDVTYCDNVKLLQGMFKSMAKREMKKQLSYFNKLNWDTYETDDGYKCSTYYVRRHEDGNNDYYLIIVGNGQFLKAYIGVNMREIDFDVFEIDKYYLEILREMKKDRF